MARSECAETHFEVRNLAQKGFDYEAKNAEINQQRQALAQREAELNQMMQAVQGFVPAQPQTPQTPPQTTEAIDESAIIGNAMKAVKERFGKDDPDFELDTLNPEQMAVYNMAVYRETAQADAQQQQKAATQQQEQARQIRLNSWEQQQREARSSIRRNRGMGAGQYRQRRRRESGKQNTSGS